MFESGIFLARTEIVVSALLRHFLPAHSPAACRASSNRPLPCSYRRRSTRQPAPERPCPRRLRNAGSRSSRSSAVARLSTSPGMTVSPVSPSTTISVSPPGRRCNDGKAHRAGFDCCDSECLCPTWKGEDVTRPVQVDQSRVVRSEIVDDMHAVGRRDGCLRHDVQLGTRRESLECLDQEVAALATELTANEQDSEAIARGPVHRMPSRSVDAGRNDRDPPGVHPIVLDDRLRRPRTPSDTEPRLSEDLTVQPVLHPSNRPMSVGAMSVSLSHRVVLDRRDVGNDDVRPRSRNSSTERCRHLCVEDVHVGRQPEGRFRTSLRPASAERRPSGIGTRRSGAGMPTYRTGTQRAVRSGAAAAASSRFSANVRCPRWCSSTNVAAVPVIL